MSRACIVAARGPARSGSARQDVLVVLGGEQVALRDQVLHGSAARRWSAPQPRGPDAAALTARPAPCTPQCAVPLSRWARRSPRAHRRATRCSPSPCAAAGPRCARTFAPLRRPPHAGRRSTPDADVVSAAAGKRQHGPRLTPAPFSSCRCVLMASSLWKITSSKSVIGRMCPAEIDTLFWNALIVPRTRM